MSLIYFVRWLGSNAAWLIKELSKDIARGCVWLFAARGCAFCMYRGICSYNTDARVNFSVNACADTSERRSFLKAKAKTEECKKSVQRTHFKRRTW